jgi:hypothetical protein
MPKMTGLKLCSSCKERKPNKDFSKCSANTDGLQSWCKKCTREKFRNVVQDGKTKQCDTCLKTLGLINFWICSLQSDGLGKTCKDCIKEIELDGTKRVCKWCLEIKPADAFGNGERYKNGKLPHCKSCKTQYVNRWRNHPENKDKCLEHQRSKRRQKKYHLEPGEFERRIEEQDNCCALCGKPFELDKSAKAPRVDHDHSTGKVRGILHSNCNVMIGLAEENTGTLRKAIDYIVKHLPSADASD